MHRSALVAGGGVTGDSLRSRAAEAETTGGAIAAAALNRMLEFGRRTYIRTA
ncbi:MAG: hypothetical protein WCC90_21940 [Methylocella sp.]